MLSTLLALALVVQVPDSTQTDSVPVQHFDVTQRLYFTRVDTLVDTVSVSGPTKGVDTLKFGADSMRLTFWSIVRKDDSVRVIITAPGIVRKAIWGPSGYFQETSASTPGALGKFTFAANESSNRDDWLYENIVEAKQRKVPVMLAFPCGSHTWPKIGYCVDTVTKAFSMTRFDSALTKRVLKPYIRDTIIAAYKRGDVVGAGIIDEPWVHGGDDGSGNIIGNSWGPPGTITKARADTLCAKTKALIPGVPVGMSGHLTSWEPTKDIKVCDFLTYQYSYRFGNVVTWREAVLAQARRGGYQVQFSFNILNGGIQDRDGTWDCAQQGGIKGQRAPNCQMTPAQVDTVVRALGPFTHGGLMTWRYDGNKYNTTPYHTVILSGLNYLAGFERKMLTPR